MTFDEYQTAALDTKRVDQTNELFHLVLGLVGETGEIAEKFKKFIRDLDSDMNKLDVADMKKELGDVLWYLTVLADYLGLSVDDIAQANIAKLQDRKARDVLKGNGDNR